MLELVFEEWETIFTDDEGNIRFVSKPREVLHLQHSLLSLSKWEEKYEMAFLTEDALSDADRMLYYIECMALDFKADGDALYHLRLTEEHLIQIGDYINKPSTATRVRRDSGGGKGVLLTSEVIYGYMTVMTIPFEAETWHLNRLLKLIEVVGELNKPKDKKKGIDSTAAAKRRALNKRRQG